MNSPLESVWLCVPELFPEEVSGTFLVELHSAPSHCIGGVAVLWQKHRPHLRGITAEICKVGTPVV